MCTTAALCQLHPVSFRTQRGITDTCGPTSQQREWKYTLREGWGEGPHLGHARCFKTEDKEWSGVIGSLLELQRMSSTESTGWSGSEHALNSWAACNMLLPAHQL